MEHQSREIAGILVLVLIFGGFFWTLAEGFLIRRCREWERWRALDLAGVDRMTRPQFERYMEKLLQDRGYRTELVNSMGDHGVDIVATRGGIQYGVHCKRQTRSVSRRAVADAVTGRLHYRADKAMVATNSWFTAGARTMAESTGCSLIGREELADWIAECQRAGHASETPILKPIGPPPKL